MTEEGPRSGFGVRLRLEEGFRFFQDANPGVTEGDFPSVLTGPICIVPAVDPDAPGLSPTEREASFLELLERLRDAGVRFFLAAIGTSDWAESVEAVAIVDQDPRWCRALARTLGQSRVLVLNRDALEVVPAVDDEVSLRRGWRFVPSPKEFADLPWALDYMGLRSEYVPDAEVREAMQRCRAADLSRGEQDSWRAHRCVTIAAHFGRHLRAQARALESAQEEVAAAEAAEAKRVHARERRALAETQRAARRETGWPAQWASETLAQRWMKLGGTPEQAAAFIEAGWTPKEVLAVAKTLGTASTLRPPPGNAALHKSFGDDLPDLVTPGTPCVTENTCVSVRREQSTGQQQRWLVDSGREGVIVSYWIRRPGDPWSSPPFATAHSDLPTAMRDSADMRTIPADALTEIRTNGKVSRHDLAGWLLYPQVPVGGFAPHTQPFDSDDGGLLDDEQLIVQVPHASVPCSIDGYRVVPLAGGPILVDVDEREVYAETSTEVAHHSWYSESGGAPISWDGGSEVCLLDGKVIQIHNWGDVSTGTRLVPVPQDDEGLARLLAAWIQDNDAHVLAAFALEPNNLPSEWRDQLESVTASVSFELTDAQEDLLRRRLRASSPEYRRTVIALTHPEGAEGQAFLDALQRTSETGVIGGLLAGW